MIVAGHNDTHPPATWVVGLRFALKLTLLSRTPGQCRRASTMKLTDFSGFEPLNSLKEKMGIPRDSFGSFNLTLDF